MGDSNAKLRRADFDNLIGPCGFERRNERDDRFLQFSSSSSFFNDLVEEQYIISKQHKGLDRLNQPN